MNPAILVAASQAPGITVSVVSHGQRAWVQQLLDALAAPGPGAVHKVVLTHNLPEAPVEAPAGGWPFALVELTNARPAGFGANHNAAFAHCTTPQFCVLNPDIVLDAAAVWPALQAALDTPEVACAYPTLVNEDGSTQDHERSVPTPAALWRRRVRKRADLRRDWVSAAFWLVRADVFRSLGGFDQRYYMYCEDTDFCLRLQQAGWALRKVPVHVVHAAARRSHRDFAHLRWHVTSLLRLWASPALWRYLRRPAA